MKGAIYMIGIVIAVLVTALITSLVVYSVMRPSIDKEIEAKKAEIEKRYEESYYKKEEQLKSYYVGLLGKEESTHKEKLKSERERYDKKLAEMAEAVEKDNQMLKIRYRQQLGK